MSEQEIEGESVSVCVYVCKICANDTVILMLVLLHASKLTQRQRCRWGYLSTREPTDTGIIGQKIVRYN